MVAFKGIKWKVVLEVGRMRVSNPVAGSRVPRKVPLPPAPDKVL